ANEKNLNLDNFKPETYQAVIERLVENNVWSGEFFNKNEMGSDDLILAASWWDGKKTKETDIGEAEFGRPGFAIELTFGYTPTLNQYSLDLSAPQSFSYRLIGRQQIVSRMERILTSGNSVLLMGQPGVGKKTVILEFAYRAVTGQFGSKMSYKRILEFDYNALLSGTMDLNHKKTKLAEILAEGAAAGNVILMIRDIQRLTNAEVEGYDFTDVFEEYLEKRELKIIAVSTNTDYERFIAPNLRLAKYMEKVEVVPPTKEEALEILVESAQRWESLRPLTITVTALRNILDESDRYVTQTPFPEKALELLEAVITYCEQQNKNIVTIDDVRVILAEKTGISFAKLTSEEKERLGKIEEIIHERLIDQAAAISLIGKTLRAKTVGVIKEDRPLGSFLFLGPTGVGKTETAKVLAKVYYGSTENILRFDMAEYSGSEGLERLIGSVNNNQPGALTTSIKNRPANILLLDEMEKASPEISNLFLALLDEGLMTDAFGKKISGRHLFVIGTSNAGAEFIRQLVGKGVTGAELQEKTVNYILEQRIFSPEFLNRFDGVVVYEPLRREDLVKIAHLMLADLAGNLKGKNIYLKFDADVAVKLAEDGYDPAFGARPMRKIVNLTIGDLLGRAILTNEIVSGDRIKLLAGQGKEEFGWEKV
ncbi:AAA family ATPase, partial [Patescibacteria group bacterium]|nr:AAA family ATPase [Patescibacteria group bacterium]